MASSERNHRTLIALAIAAAASLAAVAIVYPGLVLRFHLPVTTEGIGISDLLDQNVPLRAWAGASLAQGRLPLWYPGCYGGLPLASIPEAVPYYPFSAAFYAALPPRAATAGTIVMHLLIAGVGAALLVRQWGAGLAGQLMAAVLMSAGLHLPAHMRQLNLMQAEAWIPCAWLFLDRLLVRPSRREAAGLAFSMGMLGLAGHIEVLHHAVVMLAAWGAIRMIGLRAEWGSRRFWGARIGWLAAAAAIGAALALPHLGPIFEMSRWIDRPATRHAPLFRSLLMPFAPFVLGEPAGERGRVAFFVSNFAWEQMLYIGWLPLAMAAGYVLAAGWRRRLCRGLLALGALSLLLAYASRLGPAGSLARLIPMEGVSRFPQRYLWFFNGVLVALAAFGFDALVRSLAKRAACVARPARIALVACVAVAVAADLAFVTRRLIPLDDAAAWFGRPDSLAMLERAGASPNAFAERLGSYGFGGLGQMADVLKARTGSGRAVDTELRRFFAGEHPSLWGWQAARGYIGMTPWWSASVLGDQHIAGLLDQFDMAPAVTAGAPPPDAERFVRWSGFYGSRWLASPLAIDSPHLRPIGRIPGRFMQAFLYENMAWPGAAWVGRTFETFASSRDMFEEMAASEPDPRLVRIERADAGSEAPRGPAETAEGTVIGEPSWPDPRHVVIECRLTKPGFLVLSQNYHPRWRVRVDGGGPRRVARVNMCQTAAWIGAGEHRVVFEYPGRFEKTCLAIGLAGLLAAAACACVPSRRAQPALRP